MSVTHFIQSSSGVLEGATLPATKRSARELANALLQEITEARLEEHGESRARLRLTGSKFHSTVRSFMTNGISSGGFEVLRDAAIYTQLTDARLRTLSSAIRSLSPHIKIPRVWKQLSKAMLAYDTAETPGSDFVQRVAKSVSHAKSIGSSDKRLILSHLAPAAEALVEHHNYLREGQPQGAEFHWVRSKNFNQEISEYFVSAREHIRKINEGGYPEDFKTYGLKLIARNAHSATQAREALKLYQQLLERPILQGLSARLQREIDADFESWLELGRQNEETEQTNTERLATLLDSDELAKLTMDYTVTAGAQGEHAAPLMLQYSLIKLASAKLSPSLQKLATAALISILDHNQTESTVRQEQASSCIEFVLSLSTRTEESVGTKFQEQLLEEFSKTPQLLPRYLAYGAGTESALLSALSLEPDRLADFLDSALFAKGQSCRALAYPVTLVAKGPSDSFSGVRHTGFPLISAIPEAMYPYLMRKFRQNPTILSQLLLENEGAVTAHLCAKDPELLDAFLEILKSHPEGLKECISLPCLGHFSNRKSSLIADSVHAGDPRTLARMWELMGAAKMTKLEQIAHVVSAGLKNTLSQEEGYVYGLCSAITDSINDSNRPAKHFPKLSDTSGMQALTNTYGRICSLIGGLGFVPEPGQSSALLRGLIANERGEWVDMDMALRHRSLHDFRNITDLVRAAATWLVLPEVYLRLPEERRDNLSTTDWQAALTASLPETAEALFSHRSLSQALALSDCWHSKHELVADRMRDVAESGSWKALFQERIIEIPEGDLEGWKIVNLTSSEELKREGAILDHCVGSYGNSTRSGKSHILSVRNPDNVPESTVEITVSFKPGNKPILSVRQNAGHRNAYASSEARQVVSWLQNQVAEGEIELNKPPFGEVFENSKDVITPAVRFIGFVPQRDRNQQAFEMFASELRTGRRTYIIPGKFRNGSLKQFREGTCLERCVENLVEKMKK